MIDKKKVGTTVAYGLLAIQELCQCQSLTDKAFVLEIALYGISETLAVDVGFEETEQLLADVQRHLKNNRAQIENEVIEMMKPAQSIH
ncbi:hypothetical protein DRE94_24175 [Salmonella enterica subsp. enterica serovar Oranienburg]|nr:hypothetical protein [Salmonella enterica]EBX2202662.1 hypothetical protein [Salmonella enterica subsp. enterica serovar Oranienburg]